jgi:hypothetical protein
MTNAEILDYIKLRYDVITSSGAPGYADSDLSLFFNKAQKVFVKSLYNEDANPARKGAEETEKRSKDLSELKDHSVVSTFTSGDHGTVSYFVELPMNFWLTLKEECLITYNNICNVSVTERVPVKPIKEDYYNANIKNPYKKPFSEQIWRLDRERTDTTLALSATNLKRHELILFTGATPNSYLVSYYRRPKVVDLTDNTDFCELDPMNHEKIADIAVQLMMQTTGRQEYQTKTFENNNIIE